MVGRAASFWGLDTVARPGSGLGHAVPAASTQNQAVSALLFLYRDVLEVDLPWLDGIVRAKRPQRLPNVLTRDEVRAVLHALQGGVQTPGFGGIYRAAYLGTEF